MAHVKQATPGGRARRQAAYVRARGELPTFEEMRANLRATIDGSSFGAEVEGLAWYASAHSIAADMAVRHGLTVRQCAGVLAALSPQTGWAENIRLADEACGSGKASGHTFDACGKADRILAGEDPADVLGGRKVRSFFANIVEPGRSGAVTVDRHCVDMLVGRRGAVNDRVLERPGAYVLCAAVVRSVARDLGWRPHEVQAVAWVAWRQTHDVAFRFDLGEF